MANYGKTLIISGIEEKRHEPSNYSVKVNSFGKSECVGLIKSTKLEMNRHAAEVRRQMSRARTRLKIRLEGMILGEAAEFNKKINGCGLGVRENWKNINRDEKCIRRTLTTADGFITGVLIKHGINRTGK